MTALLSLTKIKKVIQDNCRPSRLDIFHSIPSTNSYLLQNAKQFASGSVCLAEQQTEGRGRLEKKWISPKGNIYFSLLWRFINNQNFSGLSLAIAVIISQLLKEMGVSSIQLKWPNDILFQGKKLAGILLESPNRSSVVIGIGLNMSAPAESVNAIGVNDIIAAERNNLIGLLINKLFSALPIFENQGFSAFHPLWKEYDSLLNKTITLSTGQKTITGIMRGVSEAGELLLETGSGKIESFCYGEAKDLRHDVANSR